jgi:hypothetical protein
LKKQRNELPQGAQLVKERRFSEFLGDGAAANGRSWTTVNPGALSNYRGAAGLPSQNTGRFVSEGLIQDATGVTTRSSLPLGGNLGGLPEVLIPTPASQVQLIRVSGVDPPF